MGLIEDYNRIFDQRRLDKIDRQIQKLGRDRRANLKLALELTNRRERLLNQPLSG